MRAQRFTDMKAEAVKNRDFASANRALAAEWAAGEFEKELQQISQTLRELADEVGQKNAEDTPATEVAVRVLDAVKWGVSKVDLARLFTLAKEIDG